MIPKIIHQIWLGPKQPPNQLIQTWKDKHPESKGWTHKLWTEKDLDSFNMVNIDYFNKTESYPQKADIWRYEILYKHGGIFCDADSACINPFDNTFLNNDSFACFENETVRSILISNGYIGATKNNKLMAKLIDKINKLEYVDYKLPGKDPWIITGPWLFTNTVLQSFYPIKIYPSYYFIPEHFTGVKYYGNDKIYATQYWGNTLQKYDEIN